MAECRPAIAFVNNLKRQSGFASLPIAADMGYGSVRVAAPEGVRVFQKAHPKIPVYAAALDSHLNENAYIVPGLGDAGDRLFGTK